MGQDWYRRPDMVGFEVVPLPGIEERVLLPWEDEHSIPLRIGILGFTETEFGVVGVKYERKPKIYKYGDRDWRIKVPEIAQSSIGDDFKCWEEAFEYLYELLEQKEAK
jgi:hypothetical protein